jgi:hypothetical protein
MFSFHNLADTIIAELNDEKFVISKTQDTLDLFGELIPYNCTKIIIHESNLHPDFFILRNGIAGDILQKFSNYRIKVAFVGDFSKFTSRSLQDFIRESNKGKSIFFLENTDAAFNKLTGK